MDSTTMWIVIGVVALLALFFYMRNRPAPHGTYDDKNVRSSGSIGGGARAYDDPAHRSSGSIGSSQRGYDSPEHKSSGSIGGAATNPPNAPVDRDLDPDRNRAIDRDTPLERLDNERVARTTETTHDRVDRTRQHDDERFKSKGSIGG